MLTYSSHLCVSAHGVLTAGLIALMHHLGVDNLYVLGQIRFADTACVAFRALVRLVLQVAIAYVRSQ